MARKSIYPDSVKSGIPKLGEKPERWEEIPLGEILSVVTRKANIENDLEYQLVNAKRNREGIVAREVLPGKKILTKTQFFIKEGDFLIANRQIVHGACGVVPKELDGALVSNEYTVLHPTNGLLLDFLRYYTHTIYYQQTCFQSSVGVDVEKMIFRLKDWLKYKIHLPPESEQKKIVQILSCWDRAIELMERLINAKTRLKKCLVQQLLVGKNRFPEFVKSHIKEETVFGSFPRDWSYKKLKVLVGINVKNLVESTNKNYSFFYLDLSSIKSGNIALPKKKVFFNDAPSRARRIVVRNDIIMATVRPYLQGFALFKLDIKDVICSTGFALLTSKSDYYSEYISKQFHWMTVGSNYPALNNSDVSNLRFFIPLDFNEQQKIASVLSTCDKEIEILIKKLDALKQQKKGLMQQLLTGKIRAKLTTRNLYKEAHD